VTFILALANSEEVIQISDCSVRQSEDEKFNKAGHILCDNASVLYGFTGLATIGNGETMQHAVQDWMLDALDIAMARAFESSGQHGYFIEEIEMELAYVATLHFRDAMFLENVREEDRRLTIMLTGYMNDGRIIHTLISNCLDSPTAQPKFKFMPTVLKSPEEGEPTLIQSIGQLAEFTASEERGIRELLARKAPAELIRNHAAAIVADRHKDFANLGRKITTAILRRDAPSLPILEFKASKADDQRPFLDFVRGKKGQPVKLSKDVFGSRPDMEELIWEAGPSSPLPDRAVQQRDTAAVPQTTLSDAALQKAQSAEEEGDIAV
jgi:hypothetical protein